MYVYIFFFQIYQLECTYPNQMLMLVTICVKKEEVFYCCIKAEWENSLVENYVVTLSLNAHVGLILAIMLVYVPEVILDKDLLVIVPVSGFKVCDEKMRVTLYFIICC